MVPGLRNGDSDESISAPDGIRFGLPKISENFRYPCGVQEQQAFA